MILEKALKALRIEYSRPQSSEDFEFIQYHNQTVSYDIKKDSVSWGENHYNLNDFLNYCLTQEIVKSGWDKYNKSFCKLIDLHPQEREHIARITRTKLLGKTPEEAFLILATQNTIPSITASIFDTSERLIKNLRRKMRKCIIANLLGNLF